MDERRTQQVNDPRQVGQQHCIRSPNAVRQEKEIKNTQSERKK